MTDHTASPPDRPAGFIRNPQDFYGGLGLLALAVIAWWASRELPGQQSFAFGPGTAPRLFMILLGINALGIMLHGLIVTGPPLERWHIRGPLLVLGSVLLFAATIRPFGLVISTFLLAMCSAMADKEIKWVQAAIWAAVLATFCAILFPYGLNLPMPLWPRF